ncbi:hypothetical protein [Wenzhouxiangella marina]|uniref:Uncharacterized protein n=1 Tax=Wenzhouxiangella marina TaxID=1579979 RepID=A0A0K0XXP3_9GAMM|nr:hypothetical protein [Wenzhouxiangella marina]AKS42469.1 hypothetical protein WM2015_2104 [Wenzhouxiangella marina]MBB6085756.1 hypothetical protein [Wenzhouxiangella marina]
MKTWLFKPFEKVAGGASLGLGLLIIVSTALLAWSRSLHTDGVLDLHFGPASPLWVQLSQGLIAWLSLSLVLWAAGLWLGRGGFRPIDLFGTQALARWPMLVAVAYLSIPPLRAEIERRTVELMAALPQPGEGMASTAYLADALWLTALSVPMLVMMVWMLWLMYHGYALVTDQKGQRAFFGFFGALVVASILAKALIAGLMSTL